MPKLKVSPKVYVVHEQFVIDGDNLRTRLDLTPAKKFGDFVMLFSGTQIPRNPADVVEVMQRTLCHFTRHDYLLPIGAPELIAWAAALAADRTDGHLKMLVWNRDKRHPDGGEYIVKEGVLW